MPRTLLAISNHADLIGGGEHSLIDLLRRLPPTWQPLAVVPGAGEVADCLSRTAVPFASLELPLIRPWRLPHIGLALKSLGSLCRRHKASLIYANGSRAAFYGGLVGRACGLPVIWHCRVADHDRLLDPLLERLCTRIVANSHATSMRFKGSQKKKVAVVHNGIDLEWFQTSPAERPELAGEGRKVILMVARRSPWKRHDLALAAFDQVAAADPAAHMVCIGGPERENRAWELHLHNCLNAAAFRERILWVDAMEDVRPWYHAASVFLLTSQNEPFGRVLVEAMACGVPVVATSGGGVGEVVRNGEDGFLVDSDRPADIASALLRILKDENLKPDMGRSARQRSLEFSLAAHVRRMAGVFEDSLRSFPRAGV